jgi:uncharacterized membrane protein
MAGASGEFLLYNISAKIIERERRRMVKTNKRAYYAGTGLATGAAIGMIFGLLLFENLALGSTIGAAVGLVIGAAIDAQGRHETDSAE